MDEESAQIIEEAGEKLTELAAERDIMALVYLQDTYDVKETPDEKGKTAVTVLSGQLVNLLDVYVDENYEVWEYVSLEYNGQTFYGYVKRANLALFGQPFSGMGRNLRHESCCGCLYYCGKRNLCGCRAVSGKLSPGTECFETAASQLDFCQNEYHLGLGYGDL